MKNLPLSVLPHFYDNAYHWGEIRQIKREYDALDDVQKALRKPALSALIDHHLAALKAN